MSFTWDYRKGFLEMKHFAKFNRWQFDRIDTWHVDKAKRDEFIAKRRREVLAWEVVYAERKVRELTREYQDIAARLSTTPSLLAEFGMKRISMARDEFYCETQFISFQACSCITHNRKPVYELQADGSWRELDESDWREIEDLECQILDAWEEYNEALFECRDMTGEQWAELRAQGVVA